MKYAIFVVHLSVSVLFSIPSVALSSDMPPFIRTGQDVLDRCQIDTFERQLRCDSMLATLGDATEARRWKMRWCPPTVYASSRGTVNGPIWGVLEQAKLHPEWLKLSAVEFVGRAIEAAKQCPLDDQGNPRRKTKN